MKTFFTVGGLLLVYGSLMVLLGGLVLSIVKTAQSLTLTTPF